MPPGRRYDGSIRPAGRRGPRPTAPPKGVPVSAGGGGAGGGGSSGGGGKGGCTSVILSVAAGVWALVEVAQHVAQ